jgi:hypothetical protein
MGHGLRIAHHHRQEDVTVGKTALEKATRMSLTIRESVTDSSSRWTGDGVHGRLGSVTRSDVLSVSRGTGSKSAT